MFKCSVMNDTEFEITGCISSDEAETTWEERTSVDDSTSTSAMEGLAAIKAPEMATPSQAKALVGPVSPVYEEDASSRVGTGSMTLAARGASVVIGVLRTRSLSVCSAI